MVKKIIVGQRDFSLRRRVNYYILVCGETQLSGGIFINIGVLAFWLGMIVVVGSNLEMNPTKIFNYFSVILLSYLITDIGKITLAKQLKKYLTPKVTYKIKRAMGVLLMIFGVVLILKGYIPKEKLNFKHVIEKTE